MGEYLMIGPARRHRPEKILLFWFRGPLNSVVEPSEISWVISYSQFVVVKQNLYDWENDSGDVFLPAELDLDAFAGIVFHNSVFHGVKNLDNMDKYMRRSFKDFSGVKVVLSGNEPLGTLQAEDFVKDISGKLFPRNEKDSAACLVHSITCGESFTAEFDNQVSLWMQERKIWREPEVWASMPAKNLVLLVAQEPHIDPRISWMARHAPEDLRVVVVGVDPSDAPLREDGDPNRQMLVFSRPRAKWTGDILAGHCPDGSNPAGDTAIFELLLMETALRFTEEQFCRCFGASYGHVRNRIFRSVLQYFLDTTQTLTAQILNMRNVHGIIAADLDALPAALLFKGMMNVPVYYDAHEYWPESDTQATEYEQKYWARLEKTLVGHTDHRVTVSPGLAELMSRRYGKEFHFLPNCEPVQEHISMPRRDDREGCRFIFQGGFAPNRGVELLIDAWPDTDDEAVLLLRGPDNDFKEFLIGLAQKTGLLESRIFFLPAVSESELVAALDDGDVGLVPYVPKGMNHQHCCPNKLSQYMAAGLPILANDTSFVKQIVESASAGLVLDFQNRERLVQAVSQLTHDHKMRSLFGRNGLRYYQEQYNWQNVSRGFYDSLSRTLSPIPVEPFYAYQYDEPHKMYHISKNFSQQAKILARRVWRRLPLQFRQRLKPIILSLLKR